MEQLSTRGGKAILVLLLILANVFTNISGERRAAASAQGDLWDGTTTAIVNGTGTEANPYLIESAKQLAFMRDAVNANTSNYKSAYYKLTTDIDLGKNQWTPIGNGTYKFLGTFDGDGHVIYNMKIGTVDTPNANFDYVGLFGYASGATIKNVGVESLLINTNNHAALVGGLIGYADPSSNNNTHILNCFVSGTITKTDNGTYRIPGGLIGYMDGSKDTLGSPVNVRGVANSYANVNVTSFSAGALIGIVSGNTTIDNSYAVGQVTATGSMGNYDPLVGGLIAGVMDNQFVKVTVKNSYWNNTINQRACWWTCANVTEGTTAKSTAEMQSQEFLNTLSVNKASGSGALDWIFVDGQNNGFPVLPKTYVRYNTDRGSTVASVAVTTDTAVVQPTDPTRTGYTFGGWYTTNTFTTAYDFTTIVTDSITLYAKWIPNQYTVTFNSNGGTTVDSATVTRDTAAIKPTDPTRTGYTFDGWYTTETLVPRSEYRFTAKATGNLTLYAKWTPNQYSVTFNSNGGSSVSSTTVIHDTAVTKPTDPTRTGYTFGGWYTTEALATAYDFTTKATANITLYAKWLPKQYSVTFNSNGGTTVDSATVTPDTAVTKPTDPIKTGYTFSGWYTTEVLDTVYDFTTNVTADITLYAKWIPKKYGVTFNSNVGSSVSSVTVTHDTAVTKPTNPMRTGYTFGGWYTTEAFTTAYDFTTKATADLTLYAKWIANSTGGGGGGGSTPTTPTQPTTQQIVVDVKGTNGNDLSKTPIERTKETNGVVKDKVVMPDTIAKETVEKAKEQKIETARLVIPDVKDEVAETRVEVPKTAVTELNSGKLNLEIKTENVVITIPTKSLETFKDDLYFRVVPIKTEQERQVVENRAKNEKIIQQVVQNNAVNVLGRPMEIQTNMQSRPVTLMLPLKDALSTDPVERQKIIDNLGVFIEHSDGTKELAKGTVVTKDGMEGLEFTVNKFSTFTMVYMDGFKDYVANQAVIIGYAKGDSITSVTQNVTLPTAGAQGSMITWSSNKLQFVKADGKVTRPTAKQGDQKVTLTATIKNGTMTETKTFTLLVKALNPVKPTIPTKNVAPTASNLKITGQAKVGSTLKATYTYKDVDGDKEGKSVIQWYWIDTKTKKQYMIQGANKEKFKITAKYKGKQLIFKVKVVAKTGVKVGKVKASKPIVVVK